MKTVKNIFVKFLCLAVVGVLGLSSARAAIVDESCDEHDMVRPELALCSTHAYNISLTSNPDGDADKALMKDVIAMKTTVITQQMYKQYEQMESMLGRLKTQLQKAVLTNDLKIASGDTGSDSGSSYKSDDKYRVLTGTNNCNMQDSKAKAIACLQTNVRIVSDAIAAGNTNEARKQLLKDLETAVTWQIVTGSNGTYTGMDHCTTVDKNGSKKKDDVSSCVQQFNVRLADTVSQLGKDDAAMKMLQKIIN